MWGSGVEMCPQCGGLDYRGVRNVGVWSRGFSPY